MIDNKLISHSGNVLFPFVTSLKFCSILFFFISLKKCFQFYVVVSTCNASDAYLCFSFSAISGGIVDRAIEAEDKKHGDFMRLVRYHFIWFTYRYLMPHSLLDPHVVFKPLLLPICFLL